MISFNRYAELFRVPGLRATLLASIVGRIPIGVSTLAILIFVQDTSRSFAVGGSTAAIYVFGLALAAPLIGRLIDRIGPRPLLAAAAVLHPLLLIALLTLVLNGASSLSIAISALLAGATLPPITICMRALYPRLLTSQALLAAAYSIDSALIEIIFILGPALVAACVASGFPGAAILIAAVCAASGTVVFARAPALKSWRIEPTRRQRSLLGPLRSRALLAVFAATVLYSLAFGLFEVAVTSFAIERGRSEAAGLILGLASLGSAAGALSYGGGEWGAPLARQFMIAVSALSAGLLALASISNLYLFAAVSLIAAAPMAPVIAVQSILISRLAPKDMLAESFTWGATCLLVGIGGGIAGGGVLAEYLSTQWILALAAIPPLLAGVIVSTSYRGR